MTIIPHCNDCILKRINYYDESACCYSLDGVDKDDGKCLGGDSEAEKCAAGANFFEMLFEKRADPLEKSSSIMSNTERQPVQIYMQNILFANIYEIVEPYK